MRPILVFMFKGDMAKDCCAANFERALFMYKPVVDLAKKFKCVKTSDYSIAERYGVSGKKPAVLLLDAEGGLLHKTQKCSDPRKYLRVVKHALTLNQKRVKLKDKYLALRRDARNHMEDADYAKALKDIESILKKRELLMGQVLSLVKADHAELKTTGERLIAQAGDLRGKEKLLEAYELYKEVAKGFAKLDDLGRSADRCAKEIRGELRDMGVSVH